MIIPSILALSLSIHAQEMEEWLAQQSVVGLSPHVVELYTWTTADQIDELRRGADILTRSTTSEGGLSQYQIGLAEHDGTFSDSIVALLRRNEFSNLRFAWSNPWATSAGFGKEQWGDQLLKINMKDSAITIIFGSYWHASEVYGVDGFGNEFHDLAELEGREHHIALVYHYYVEYKLKSTRRARTVLFTITQGAPFREFVIINEEMIESFEYGTPAILEGLHNDADQLHAIAEELDNTQVDKKDAKDRDYLTSIWHYGGNQEQLLDLFIGSTAFYHKDYRMDARSIGELAERTEELIGLQGEPFGFD